MSQTEQHEGRADEPRPITVDEAAEIVGQCAELCETKMADLITTAGTMLAGAELGMAEWTDAVVERLSRNGAADAKAMFQEAIDERRARIAKVAADMRAKCAEWLEELQECDEDARELNWEANAEAQ